MITKKTILALIPWILLFCAGLVLLFRPAYFERNRLRDKTVFEFAFYEHALIFHKLG